MTKPCCAGWKRPVGMAFDLMSGSRCQHRGGSPEASSSLNHCIIASRQWAVAVTVLANDTKDLCVTKACRAYPGSWYNLMGPRGQ